MSRWICIDDICIPSDENDWEELVAFADAIAEQEPIEIIRCRDCKYYEAKENWCYWRDEAITADGFCSYGVHKTNTTAEEKPTPIRDYMVHGEREGE